MKEALVKTLTLETLGDLNGGMVGAAVNTAIAQVMRDCEDRPALDGPRVVTLEIGFVPVMDASGDLIGVHALPSVKQPKIPAMKIPAQILATRIRHGDLGEIIGVEAVFENPYQQKLLDDDEGKPVRKGAN
jgi:hypothetical protein